MRAAQALRALHARAPCPRGGNIPDRIWALTSSRLHVREGHPLSILRGGIERYVRTRWPGQFVARSDLSPVVTADACFDQLCVPLEHPSRRESDTYYVDAERVELLRTHMTVHDVDMLRSGAKGFVTCGDVYRRDTVDHVHYPIFHQMDGVRLVEGGEERVVADLKGGLEGLAGELFGEGVGVRWVEGSFPFTNPSFEMEVWWKGEWLELLGCGVLRREVLRAGGVPESGNGWAFGLGLERIAMVLFDIPDIRLFWSEDERFLSQFRGKGLEARFEPFSVYPGVEKDVSFWIDGAGFHENDVHELARAAAGDLVESVRVVDTFEKDDRISMCFRVMFRSMERNLTHKEVNVLNSALRESIAERLPVTLR